MKSFIVALLATFLMMGTALASDWYVKGGINQTDADLSSGFGSFDLEDTTGASISVGYNFNNFFATEIEYSDLGSGNVGGISHDTSSVTLWGVFDPVIGSVSGMDVKFIGKAGISDSEIEFTSVTISDTALALGAGIGISVTTNTDILLEYVHREISDSIFGIPVDADIDTVSLSAKFEF